MTPRKDDKMWTMLERLLAGAGLLVLSPLLAVVLFLVWRQDRHSPFYIADRTGLNGQPFRMVKIRSMVINADKSGVDSTANDDNRITAVGHFVRRYKLDELAQLINVVKGDMGLVGPRPNVTRETELYTSVEKRLLEVRPGITDFSSIVFSDEGKILEGSENPDVDYHQLIRPGKSKLGLFYIDKRSATLNVYIIFLTILAVACKECALSRLVRLLERLGADDELLRIAARKEPLQPSPPPGATTIVTNREGRVDEEA